MAIAIAKEFEAEIVSVDSMQVYRGMDVGTAKPTALERLEVVHHMVDVVDPEQEYSVAEFQTDARMVLTGDKSYLITGGSGLHYRALVDPMSFAPTEEALRAELEQTSLADLVGELDVADPTAGLHVDLNNKRRVVRAVEILRLTGLSPSERAASAEAEDLRRYVSEVEFTAVGVDPGEALDDRVDRRLGEMKQAGLVDEVRGLLPRLGRTARAAVGYREIADVLETGGDVEEAMNLVALNTKKLAKKQRTWFQRDPRIRWIPWFESTAQRVERAIETFDESD